MIIREFRESDIAHLERIHKQYEGEFSLETFNDRNFLGMFTAEIDGEVLLTGGVRTLAEIVVVTDKTACTREKREAFYKALDAANYLCNTNFYPELHAFVQDEAWLRVMVRRGFKIAKGQALVIPTI